jgi:hypothetical protein
MICHSCGAQSVDGKNECYTCKTNRKQKILSDKIFRLVGFVSYFISILVFVVYFSFFILLLSGLSTYEFASAAFYIFPILLLANITGVLFGLVSLTTDRKIQNIKYKGIKQNIYGICLFLIVFIVVFVISQFF